MKNRKYLIQKVKLFSQHALLLLVGFSLTISSCKKKEAAPVKPDDVYVAGYFTVGLVNYPAYWKNGEKHSLGADAGIVNAIAVNGADVYAVGVTIPNQITLWKNGKAINVILNPLKDVANSSIAVSGTTVYIAATQLNNSNFYVAKCWKVDTSTEPAIITPMPLDLGLYNSKASYANAVAVSGGHVYITGAITNNSSNPFITLWKDNDPYKNLTDGSSPASGFGIALSGADTYINGFENGTAKYWKNNDPAVPVGPLNKSSEFYNCIAVTNNKVYMAYTDNSGALPRVQCTQGPPLISSTGYYSGSIAIAGDNVYITGNDTISGKWVLWKNGQQIPIAKVEEKISVNALFVVKN